MPRYFPFVLVLIYCTSNCLYSQQEQLGLEELLAKSKKFRYTDYDSAMYYHTIGWKQAAQVAQDSFLLKFKLLEISIAEHHQYSDRQWKAMNDLDSLLAQATNQEELAIENLKLDNDLYRGVYFYNLGLYQDAVPYFDKIIQVIRSRSNKTAEDYSFLDSAYSYLANIFTLQQQFNRAEVYYREIIRLAKLKADEGEITTSIAAAYGSLGTNLIKQKKLDQALPYLQTYQKIYQEKFESTKDAKYTNSLAAAYRQLAVYHTANGSPDSSIYYYQQSLPIYNKNNIYKNYSWAGMGNAFNELGNYQLSKINHEKALAGWKKRYGNRHRRIGKTYTDLGRLAVTQKRYDEALQYYQQAIISLSTNFSDTTLLTFPDVKTIVNLPEYIITLRAKAAAYQEKYQASSENVTYLENAITTNLKGIDVLESLRTNIYSEKDRMGSIREGYPLFEQALELQLLLAKTSKRKVDLEQVWHLMESAKSLELLARLRQLNTVNGIAVDLVEKEKIVIAKINRLQNKRIRYHLKKDTPNIQKITAELFPLQRDLQNLTDQIKTQYPDYYQARYGTEVIDLKTAQSQLLQENEALINYFWGEEKVYRFTLTKDEMNFIELGDIEVLSADIESFMQLCRQHQSSIVALQEVQQKIVHLLPQDLLVDMEQLFILPDGLLHYLPFEVLPTSDNTSDFAISKYAISYAASATLLSLQQDMTVHRTTQSFAAFAPAYPNPVITETSNNAINWTSFVTRGKQIDLPFAQAEAKQATDIFNGKSYLKNAATETAFRASASDYQILHLALHALANESEPDLSQLLLEKDSINDGALTVAELYSLRLNADLAVLSACNTGYGQLQNGEGILSLSRAFHYAGVPATVVSLWQVPDRQTSEITIEFFKNIKAGLDKPAALRQAKLTYLENQPALELRHPYYWAGLVLSGNTKPLSQGLSWWWALIIISFGFVGYIFLKK